MRLPRLAALILASAVLYGVAAAVTGGDGGPSVALGPRGTVVLLWP